MPRHDIEDEIMRLLAQRATAASICPSDVARSLHHGEARWRVAMPAVRDAARRMARDGRVVIARGGVALDPEAPFGGPVRLLRGPRFGG